MTDQRSRVARIVLDTNVVLSALVFNAGPASSLRRAWQAGLCEPLVSTATVAELIRVLAYPKFRLGRDEQEELLADYLPYATTVDVSRPPKVPICRDPFDLSFLQLAITGKAHALVSGDKDLLALANAFPVPILTLDSFLTSMVEKP